MAKQCDTIKRMKSKAEQQKCNSLILSQLSYANTNPSYVPSQTSRNYINLFKTGACTPTENINNLLAKLVQKFPIGAQNIGLTNSTDPILPSCTTNNIFNLRPDFSIYHSVLNRDLGSGITYGDVIGSSDIDLILGDGDLDEIVIISGLTNAEAPKEFNLDRSQSLNGASIMRIIRPSGIRYFGGKDFSSSTFTTSSIKVADIFPSIPGNEIITTATINVPGQNPTAVIIIIAGLKEVVDLNAIVHLDPYTIPEGVKIIKIYDHTFSHTYTSFTNIIVADVNSNSGLELIINESNIGSNILGTIHILSNLEACLTSASVITLNLGDPTCFQKYTITGKQQPSYSILGLNSIAIGNLYGTSQLELVTGDSYIVHTPNIQTCTDVPCELEQCSIHDCETTTECSDEQCIDTEICSDTPCTIEQCNVGQCTTYTEGKGEIYIINGETLYTKTSGSESIDDLSSNIITLQNMRPTHDNSFPVNIHTSDVANDDYEELIFSYGLSDGTSNELGTQVITGIDSMSMGEKYSDPYPAPTYCIKIAAEEPPAYQTANHAIGIKFDSAYINGVSKKTLFISDYRYNYWFDSPPLGKIYILKFPIISTSVDIALPTPSSGIDIIKILPISSGGLLSGMNYAQFSDGTGTLIVVDKEQSINNSEIDIYKGTKNLFCITSLSSLAAGHTYNLDDELLKVVKIIPKSKYGYGPDGTFSFYENNKTLFVSAPGGRKISGKNYAEVHIISGIATTTSSSIDFSRLDLLPTDIRIVTLYYFSDSHYNTALVTTLDTIGDDEKKSLYQMQIITKVKEEYLLYRA